ncbi:hypothetical protein [uncultured Algibacter sp.]|uniref:hypothetical protein n=1 Tax=uncultured Algibacter sp. TaxID=298659 RepID=UPI0032164267
MTISLDNYIHHETILRFTDAYEMDIDEAKDIFNEMKKLLSLMNHYGDNEYIFTHEPLWIVDEMWHTFLLYTKEYRLFCNTYFGRIIDHDIVVREQKQKIIVGLEDKDSEITDNVSDAVKRLYQLIYDFLGRDTLIKWIDVYGKKYTIPYINSIRKPIQ